MDLKFALVFCLVSIVFADDPIKPKESEVPQKVEETNVTDSVSNNTVIDSRRFAPRMAYIKPTQQVLADNEYCKSTDIVLKVLDFVLKLFLSDEGKASQLMGLRNVLNFLKIYVTRLPRDPSINDLINNYDQFLNILNYKLPYNNNYQEGSDIQPTWRPNDDYLEKLNIYNIITNKVPDMINDSCKEALYEVIEAAKKAYFKLVHNPECLPQGPFALPNRPYQYDNTGNIGLSNGFPDNLRPQNEHPGSESYINSLNIIKLGAQLTPPQGNYLRKPYIPASHTPFGFENLIPILGGANPQLYPPSTGSEVAEEFLNRNRIFQSNNYNMLGQQSQPLFVQQPRNSLGSAKPEFVKLSEGNDASANTFGYASKYQYKRNSNKNLLYALNNLKLQKSFHPYENLPSYGLNYIVGPTKVKKNRNSYGPDFNNQQDIQPFVNNGNGADISYLETLFDPNFRPLLAGVQQPALNFGENPSSELLKEQTKELLSLNHDSIKGLGSSKNYPNGLPLLQSVYPSSKSMASAQANLKPNPLMNPDASQPLLYANTPYLGSSAYVLNQHNGNPYADGLPYQYNLGAVNPNNVENFSNYPRPYQSQLAADNTVKFGELQAVENSNKLKQANPGVIMLTYLVKRPSSLKYQPLYYVKYRLPYSQFLKSIKKVGNDSDVQNEITGLRQHLIMNSSIVELSPDLKNMPIAKLSSLVLKAGELVGADLIDKNKKVINLATTDEEFVRSYNNPSLRETISDDDKKLIETLTVNIDPKKVLELNKNVSRSSNGRINLQHTRYGQEDTDLPQSVYGEFYSIKNRNKIHSQFEPLYNFQNKYPELYKYQGQRPSSEYNNDRKLSVIPLHANQQHNHFWNRRGKKKSFIPPPFYDNNAGLIPAVLTSETVRHPGYYQPLV